MRKILLILSLCVLSTGLFATINSRELFLEYYSYQSMENFLKAYHHFTISAEMDTTKAPDISYFYLMNIHNMEANRHLKHLVDNVDSYGAGLKFQIANTLLEKGKFDEAIEIYKKAIADNPNWSCAWRHKGEAYFMKKDYPHAEIALKKSIETRTTHYDAYLMLADVYFQQKKNKLALETMEKAFEFRGLDEEDEEEVYSIEAVQFLYLQILKANKSKKAKELETQLKTKYPENSYWKK